MEGRVPEKAETGSVRGTVPERTDEPKPYPVCQVSGLPNKSKEKRSEFDKMKRLLIAIDPGLSGAIASRDPNGRVYVEKMPRDAGGILEYLRVLSKRDPGREYLTKVLLENVGYYRPGNSGPAACTFARHCGELEMALVALELPFVKLVPHSWMKAVFGDSVPHDKRERKEYIYQRVQQMFPNTHVLKYQADALGMLRYLIQEKGEKQ
jgi:hypothetical protein